ncbi:diacylglycerol kinase family protein [Telmatospirillum sp. J64-1]|uniref:diacylglycerol/lipid kinase family protein n=1 Tax=Telmatospirillum sp. J64-1 TaxID=2502183 RepID=UPI00115D87DC|nr:diacylglycerol kinase family protein [Telmatospirillum sp. J64-1]
MTTLSPAGQRPAFRHLLVVYNPTAGARRQRRLQLFLEELARAGCRYELFATTQRGDAETAASTAGDRGFDLIVAAGGDGTLNEVVNGLAMARRKLPVAFMPLGTANVLAAEIRLSCAPRKVAKAVLEGRLRTIRLGEAQGRYFVLMASVGADAAVVHGLDLDLKRRLGKLAYGLEACRRALSYGFPSLEVIVDGVPYTARMVVACKARCYGGPFRAAPDADLCGEMLHAVLLERAGAWSMLRYGLALGLGRLGRLPDVRIVPGRRIVINGPAGTPVQADGDPLGLLPVEISVSGLVVDLVVPETGEGALMHDQAGQQRQEQDA